LGADLRHLPRRQRPSLLEPNNSRNGALHLTFMSRISPLTASTLFTATSCHSPSAVPNPRQPISDPTSTVGTGRIHFNHLGAKNGVAEAFAAPTKNVQLATVVSAIKTAGIIADTIKRVEDLQQREAHSAQVSPQVAAELQKLSRKIAQTKRDLLRATKRVPAATILLQADNDLMSALTKFVDHSTSDQEADLRAENQKAVDAQSGYLG